MPGLLRGVARTAVVAGTATAVSGRVQRRQAEKYASRDAQIAADRTAAYQQDVAQQQPQYAPPPQPQYEPEPEPEGPDMITQLKQLAELRDQGILTEDEFAAQKAKLLG
jgi:Short C-terminal domain